MNSYMPEQDSTFTADQMHNFLKDKQAWENAIILYQGTDPLDHWYNYVCWYENYGHGDLDNKFRETLERCLSLFEHHDYYKNDTRMIRLWLKYIDMQPNPLHFYQVLYQRGVGRQLAIFYISWGAYYESIQAFKDAESIYNLGFQEKAQPYAELQHALVKLMYARSAIQQQQQQQLQLQQQQQQQQHHQQQQQQQQQQKNVMQQQVTYQNNNVHCHVHEQTHAQHQQQQHHQSTNFQRNQLAYNQIQQEHVANVLDTETQHHYMQQPQQHQQNQQQQQQQSQSHENEYHTVQLHTPNIQTQINVPHHHHHHSPHSHPHHHHHHNLQHIYHPHHHNVHNHIQQLQQIEQLTHNVSATGISPPTDVFYEQEQEQAILRNGLSEHIQSSNETEYNVQQTTSIEQKHNEYGIVEPTISESLNESRTSTSTNNDSCIQILENMESNIVGIKLPKRFVNYARNNHETWKPALCLEEPADSSRVCHYIKNQVYPEGIGVEFSPEELRAAKIYTLKTAHNQPLSSHQHEIPQPANESESTNDSTEHEENYELNERVNNIPEETTLTDDDDAEEDEEEDNNDDENDDDDDDNDNDDEDYADFNNDDYDDDEEDDDDNDDYNVNYKNKSSINHNNIKDKEKQPVIVNPEDELIEASTIRLSNNKTIKIKFKKEQTSSSTNTVNGCNYGAYKIESIYQQEIPSPINTNNTVNYNERRNGHNFHPYLLGRTSTPKIANTKRHKSKLKHIKHDLPQIQASSSNSSATDGDNIHNNRVINNINHMQYGHHNIVQTNDNAVQNASFNDNANFSFSSAVALDNSNCSISSAVGRLNFKDTSALGMGLPNSNATNNNNNNNNNNGTITTNTTAVPDFSTYQENSYFATQHDTEAKDRRLQKALDTIERHLAKDVIDPFNSELCRAFLTKVDFPASNNIEPTNYKIIQTPLPKVANTRALNLGDNICFNIEKEVGRGSYGSVYKATDVNNGAVVAIKYQKPPNTWEIYICIEVLKRIKSPNILPGLMDISTAIIAPNASLIATEFSPFGSLLDINNKLRQATTKVMHESLVMHFSAQICHIIHHLHKHQIIHADIKPDNFLLMRVPSTDLHYPSLRLIDFGCAIDMSLFPNPDSTKFRKVIQTDGFTCIEMQEGRPWSYETDLFCVAGTIHVMLLGDYMQLQKRADTWDIKQKLPRYLKKHLWTHFFGELLNIKPSKLPDLNEMRLLFEEEVQRMDSELQKQIRTLSNILYRR